MFLILLSIIYLAFISLGLPDALLGSAWPSIYPELNVSISSMGLISMIIAACTIISSLLSDKLTRKLGTGKVTAISVAITAVALFGFFLSHQFWMLCLWAIPYGLGAGSVDASLNNYVSLHYSSRHMSWLHCMWGIGASVGPYIMGFALSLGQPWNNGYLYISIIQIVLTVVLIFSLPLWKIHKKEEKNDSEGKTAKPLSLRGAVKMRGVKAIMITFFCYCALEQTAGLWASSYLTLNNGVSADEAAGYAGMFYIGITLGRVISGFVADKIGDRNMVRYGQGIILVGILVLVVSKINILSLIGLVLIGLGCAPIYPSIIHSTPGLFGKNNSQVIIGIQMASAYVGTCLMPPLYGLLADYVNPGLLPVFLIVILLLMTVMHEKANCRKLSPAHIGF